MSTKGTFTLITNSGLQDQILLASDLLHKRLEDIKINKINEKLQSKYNELTVLENTLEKIQLNLNQIRLKSGYSKEDILYIDDLIIPNSKSPEKDRILYNKITSNENLNENFKYLIKQKKELINQIGMLNSNIYKEKNSSLQNNGYSYVSMSDIEKTHINFMYKTFKPFVAIGFEYCPQDPIGASYSFGQNIRFKMENRGDYIHDQVLHIRLENLRNINPLDRVRYCDMLGHRLMEKVKFSVNLNTLDQYDSERYNNYYNFELPEERKVGWLRNVGQTVPQIGYLTSDVVNFDFSEVRWISDGPQTLKTSHDVVDLYIPLLFWFNRDIGLALPNAVIPSGQTYIDVKIADVGKICASDNRSGTGTDNFIKPIITIARLYTNQIYVNPEIHDLMLQKTDFTLIRVHKQFSKILDKAEDSIWLSDLKFPIEHMYFNFKPVINEDGPNNMDLWDQSTFATLDEKLTAGIVITNAPLLPPVYAPAASFIRHFKEVPSVSRLTLTAYGIPLYDNYPAQLFNSYLPWKFGKMNTPEDLGYYFVNFNMNPGEYQPSGHFNASRAREFYIKYISPYFTPDFLGKFSITAICLNFLLVRDGSAILKFST